MENVQVRATDELDQGTSRERRGASVQPGIVSTNCCDIYVFAGVFCLSLAYEASFLQLLPKVYQTFQDLARRVKLARVADILNV